MRFCLFACLSLLLQAAYAQQQLGLRLENYAGASSLTLNPAGNLTNPLKWDIRLAGAGLFFENNYFFIQQTSTLDLLRHANGAEFKLAKNLEGQAAPDAYIIDFYNDHPKRYVAFNGYVDGPSVVVKIGENHSAGIFTRLRSAVSTHGIINEFSYYKYDGRPFFDPFQVPKFQAALMTWAEIGLNYALKIPNTNGYLGIGANVRYLQGFEAAYVENNGTWEHTKMPGNTISVAHPNGHFGYTSSALHGDGVTANGSGFGFDLGATQVFEDGSDFYKLRLGASLLDIGYLRYSSNAADHRVTTTGTPTLALDDYEQFKNADQFDDLVQLFSQQTLGDSLASKVANEFTLTLPTAISLQADYAIADYFFANATLVQRISLGGVTARRGNLFALTPRFEHRWLSASLPLSIYNWKDVRIGLAARLGFLVIGTDNLGSFFNQARYTGTDFYIALKINPFETNLSLLGGGRGKRHYGGRGKVKCYDF